MESPLITLDNTVYLSHMGYVISSRSIFWGGGFQYNTKKKPSSDSHDCDTNNTRVTNANILHERSETHIGMFIERDFRGRIPR